MYRNVLDYFEKTVAEVPEKVAFSGEHSALTFRELYDYSKAMASTLIRDGYTKEPILVFMEKSPEEICTFFGIIRSGCFYVPIDEEMPAERIRLIIENCSPRAMICDEKTREKAEAFSFDGRIYAYSELASGEKGSVKHTVTVADGKTVDVPDIYIHTGKANGTSMVRGWVQCTWFDKNANTVRTGWALGERVYIQRMGEEYYFDDTRVGLGGVFYFQKLPPDTYVIYALGQYNDETPYVVYDTVSVDATGRIYDADTLNIRLKA